MEEVKMYKSIDDKLFHSMVDCCENDLKVIIAKCLDTGYGSKHYPSLINNEDEVFDFIFSNSEDLYGAINVLHRAINIESKGE